MSKKTLKILFMCLICFLITISNSYTIMAENNEDNEHNIKTYQPEHTKYEIFIHNRNNVLTQDEIDEIYPILEEISTHGNVALILLNENKYDTLKLCAKSFCQNYFNQKKIVKTDNGYLEEDIGVVVIIDTSKNKENMLIYNCNYMSNVLSDNNCELIMGNTYKYAENKEYFKCIKESFSQVNEAIKNPITFNKHIIPCALITAIVFALAANSIFAIVNSTTKNATTNEEMNNIYQKINITNTTAKKKFF